MGVLALDAPMAAFGPGYGRWRFTAEKVVKWNAVYRVRDPQAVPAGEYAFRLIIAVGTREDVRSTLEQLQPLRK